MAKVYYTDFHTKSGKNILQKLKKLIEVAGIEQINFENRHVAIKIHFGEPGNLAYIRPNYAKVIVDKVRSLKGKPFLTDCNTLYVGRRNEGLNHLEAAYENGFNPFSTNTHVIIGDGIKGTDDIEIPINLEYVKAAKIGRAIADSDIIISMNHFKGHESAGFGGALKNLGMGCGSRAGKMEMHSSGKPRVNEAACRFCKKCAEACAHQAIFYLETKKAYINQELCVGCGRCIGACAFNAIKPIWNESEEILVKKIAEYSVAVVKNKPNFHINFVMDVSPDCDCANYNDIAVVPNIGILASFDPVALDQASVDLVNAAPIVEKSSLDEKKHHHDKFKMLHPDTKWEAGLIHGEKIGLGERKYELIEVK